MKLWIESFVLEGLPTGVGRFIGNVLRIWGGDTPGFETILLVRNRLSQTWDALSALYPVQSIPQRQNSFLMWQQGPVASWLNHRKEPGIYLGPNYSLPLRIPYPGVVILHDVSFFRHPEWFPPRFRLFYKHVIARSISKAHVIFVPSETIRMELFEFFPAVDDKVVTVYEGWDKTLLEPPSVTREDLFARYRIPLDAFVFLFVGALFQRRRIDLLLDTWKRLDRCDLTRPPHLVIIGENRTHPYIDYPSMALELGLENKIHFLGYVNEELLRAFYAHADALVYLSEYEGFGLPILEALALGKPVIASDIPVFRELFDNKIRRVPLGKDAFEPLFQEIQNIVENHAPLAGAEEIVARYTWENTASTMFRALQEISLKQTPM